MSSWIGRFEQGNPRAGKGEFENKNDKYRKAEMALQNLIEISHQEEKLQIYNNSFEEMIEIRNHQSSSRWSNRSECQQTKFERRDHKSTHSLNRSSVKPKVDCYMNDKFDENKNKKKQKFMNYSNLIHPDKRDLKQQQHHHKQANEALSSNLVFVAKLKSNNKKYNNYYNNLQAKRTSTKKITQGTAVPSNKLEQQFTPKSIPILNKYPQMDFVENQNNNYNNKIYESENLRSKLISKNSMRIFRHDSKQKQLEYTTPEKNIITRTGDTGDYFTTAISLIKKNNSHVENTNCIQSQKLTLLRPKKLDERNRTNHNNNTNSKKIKIINLDIEFPMTKSIMLSDGKKGSTPKKQL